MRVRVWRSIAINSHTPCTLGTCTRGIPMHTLAYRHANARALTHAQTSKHVNRRRQSSIHACLTCTSLTHSRACPGVRMPCSDDAMQWFQMNIDGLDTAKDAMRLGQHLGTSFVRGYAYWSYTAVSPLQACTEGSFQKLVMVICVAAEFVL